jgi:hypothetical protein
MKTVKQMRGPGMNKGLKKPRKNTFPKAESDTPSREQKAAMKDKPVSYLPPEGKGGKPRAPKPVKGPKGKAPFKL